MWAACSLILAGSASAPSNRAAPNSGRIPLCKNEITINAPSDFVYPYISDGDKIGRWSRDDRLTISFPRGTAARIGMQIRFVIQLPTNPAWMVEIQKLEAGREMQTAIIDGIFRGSISFFLEPLDKNTTKLIHEAEIIPQGSFMQFAWKTIGREIHRKKMDEIMTKIKDLVETEWKQQTRANRNNRRKADV